MTPEQTEENECHILTCNALQVKKPVAYMISVIDTNAVWKEMLAQNMHGSCVRYENWRIDVWHFRSPGLCLNIKTVFPGIPMLKIRRSRSVLSLTWDPYTGKTTSLYWDGPHDLVTQRPRQYGRYFENDIFKFIFFNEKLNMSPKFLHRVKLSISHHWSG